MPRFRHADIHPYEPEDAEGREQPEGVGLADRIDDREEESADQERRAPVDAVAYAGSMTTFVLTGVRG